MSSQCSLAFDQPVVPALDDDVKVLLASMDRNGCGWSKERDPGYAKAWEQMREDLLAGVSYGRAVDAYHEALWADYRRRNPDAS